ncbi:hypothetical protein HR060_01465 [Catenovulum sp. SM1970]|uniref:hypothetical protein n=1 Tax=Marinifaba aquimaris TaxID=2741323 RepID=UPI0015728B3E|nr:hypothetical protein [Marinifaba aquimaris]NTS75521.1 hypothetical protein [Marinifaba aquimaris]
MRPWQHYLKLTVKVMIAVTMSILLVKLAKAEPWQTSLVFAVKWAALTTGFTLVFCYLSERYIIHCRQCKIAERKQQSH